MMIRAQNYIDIFGKYDVMNDEFLRYKIRNVRLIHEGEKWISFIDKEFD